MRLRAGAIAVIFVVCNVIGLLAVAPVAMATSTATVVQSFVVNQALNQNLGSILIECTDPALSAGSVLTVSLPSDLGVSNTQVLVNNGSGTDVMSAAPNQVSVGIAGGLPGNAWSWNNLDVSPLSNNTFTITINGAPPFTGADRGSFYIFLAGIDTRNFSGDVRIQLMAPTNSVFNSVSTVVGTSEAPPIFPGPTPNEAAQIKESGAVIDIPAGIYTGDYSVSVARMQPGSQYSYPEGMIPLGNIYRITSEPDNYFAKSVRVWLPAPGAGTEYEKGTEGVYWYDSQGKWVILQNIGMSEDGKLIGGDINHFSVFAVLGREKAPTETNPPVENPPQETVVETPSFTDIQGHWAASFILDLASQGVVSGYEDGTFRPEAPVTRAEFAVMLVKAFNLEPGSAEASFTDVADHWARNEIETVASLGIVAGTGNGLFSPDIYITRQEMAVMIARAAGLDPGENATAFLDDDQMDDWAKPWIRAVLEAGIMKGTSAEYFEPFKNTSRAEAAAVICQAVD